MQSRGFVIFAEGEEYVKQAYLAALSLQASHNQYPVSVITNNKVKSQYRPVFDKIVEIPWYEPSETRLKTDNRWKIYHVTTYNETIVLDSDVLVLQNLEYFWNFLNNYDLYFPSRVFTYRKELVTSEYYRKAFVANNFPNFYNVVHYFKKCDWTKKFYDWVELVNNNWELFYGNFCKEYYPKEPSMDVTTAIVAKILDCDSKIANLSQDIPEIIHMKPHIQNWRNPQTSWQDRVGVYLSEDLQLKIGNHRQDTIFHYTENNFVRDAIIRKYENCLRK